MEKVVNSPFACSRDFAKREYKETEYIHYMEVEEVSKDFNPEKPSEFLIEKKIEEYERIPIDEYINSFASKVGLKNELKGIISKQQMDDYISNHKAVPGFVDLTKLPDTEFEMSQFVARTEEIWDSIPSELKGTLTKEEFLKTLTSEKIRDYITSQVEKQTPKSEEKGEE